MRKNYRYYFLATALFITILVPITTVITQDHKKSYDQLMAECHEEAKGKMYIRNPCEAEDIKKMYDAQ